ncbi:hypothetical protein B9Q17_00995 [Marinobacter vinifirmus]|uniref:Uncharacterized protein n=2 Tax=Marinobacter vinifirmus TaxID=355591 RepID=A0A7Z1ILD1_9GAMM|nr:hypothetical protein [Marinobacter vinifirmus]OZC34512.1 hypothetical protein B9Q17_00995 [Marinobacter vinifirmus]
MHTLNTFLFGDPEDWSREKVFDLVRDYFSKDADVEFSEEEVPFGNIPPKLRVGFGDYFFKVSVIEDKTINESISHIKEITGENIESQKELLCEFRTTFSNDKDSDFDHIAISMYQFLENLPFSLVYDDSHKKVILKNI